MKLSTILKRECTPEEFEQIRWAMSVVKKVTQEHRNELDGCSICNRPIEDVQTQYPKEVVLEILGIAMLYVRITGEHEFTVADLQKKTGKQLTHTAYCNINHFVRFGGIMYRPIDPETGEKYKSSHFGINMQRAREFFRGERPCPIKIMHNRFTNESTHTNVMIGDFPHMIDLIDDEGNYNPYAL